MVRAQRTPACAIPPYDCRRQGRRGQDHVLLQPGGAAGGSAGKGGCSCKLLAPLCWLAIVSLSVGAASNLHCFVSVSSILASQPSRCQKFCRTPTPTWAGAGHFHRPRTQSERRLPPKVLQDALPGQRLHKPVRHGGCTSIQAASWLPPGPCCLEGWWSACRLPCLRYPQGSCEVDSSAAACTQF